jgi:hypothetical protein
VADDFDLAQFGKLAWGLAVGCAKEGGGIDRGHVERGQLVGALAGRGLLEEQSLVLGLVRADFAGGAWN